MAKATKLSSFEVAALVDGLKNLDDVVFLQRCDIVVVVDGDRVRTHFRADVAAGNSEPLLHRRQQIRERRCLGDEKIYLPG